MEKVKGFQDCTGNDALKRAKIRDILVENFRLYGYEPAETPTIEYEEFVKKSDDEVISDIFRLQDKGKRKLALRYEFTFQLNRIAQNKKLPYKRYQIGSVFRDEPASSNRFREFVQCDVDVIGSNYKDDAEVLKITSKILNELGLKFEIYINSRKLLNEILDKEGIKQKEEVIRELDKLDKVSEKEVKINLKKYKAEKILNLLKKNDFEKYENYQDIKELEKYCKYFDVKVKFSPTLARGLGYYNGNVFEIKSKDMKETIVAGGSYLVNGIQSTGLSFGLDRLAKISKVDLESIQCLIINIKQEKESIKLAEKLREDKVKVIILDKIGKALDYANSMKIPYVIFVGQDEVKKKKFKLKNMETGKEEFLEIEKIKKKII
ncbi:histidine--tRNA ligase [archaeon]|nr:histidine--tRNA ligase [archaeon]